MSIWPVVLNISSNVDTTYSAPQTGYTYKTIPEHIDITVKAKMLDTIAVNITAIPDPDFEIYHYPGIEIYEIDNEFTTTSNTYPGVNVSTGSTTITTTYVDADGNTVSENHSVPTTSVDEIQPGGETVEEDHAIPRTMVEEKEMPEPPSGISFSLSSSSEGATDFISVSGGGISINVSDSKHLFPFERMEYKKDWKDKVKTDFFPWEVSPDEYDTISAIQPSKDGTWSGHVTAEVNSSSTHSLTVTLRVIIENEYDYWVDEYITDMINNAEMFVEDIEEDDDLEVDLLVEPKTMELEEEEYVEVSEELFNEDKNGNRISKPITASTGSNSGSNSGSNAGSTESTNGNSIDDILRNGGDVSKMIDSIVRTQTDGSIEIPDLSRHKEDMLRRAMTMLENDGYVEPKKLIDDAHDYMVYDYKLLPKFLDIRDAMIKGQFGFVSNESYELQNDSKLSPNKRQGVASYMEAINTRDTASAIDGIDIIIERIRNNEIHRPTVEIIKTKMLGGDTKSALEYLSELLDGETKTFDNIPNPDISNLELDAKGYINPKKDSKKVLQDWLDKNLKGKT